MESRLETLQRLGQRVVIADALVRWILVKALRHAVLATVPHPLIPVHDPLALVVPVEVGKRAGELPGVHPGVRQGVDASLGSGVKVGIGAAAAVDDVVAVAAEDHVLAVAAFDRVIAGAAVGESAEIVLPVDGPEPVGLAVRRRQVCAAEAGLRIRQRIGVKRIHTRARTPVCFREVVRHVQRHPVVAGPRLHERGLRSDRIGVRAVTEEHVGCPNLAVDRGREIDRLHHRLRRYRMRRGR